MKIRRSIFLLCAVAAVVVALLIWFARKPIQSTTTSTRETETFSKPASEPAETKPRHRESGLAARTNEPKKEKTAVADVPTSPLETKTERARKGLATLNDEEVVFYGKVLDQLGLPVVNADVSASIRVNNGTRVGVDRFSLSTDENGLFTISGYKGKDLGIWVTKKGYVMATANTSFVYSLLWSESERHNPDANNPTVIQMWKLHGAEPLARIDQHYRLPYTGEPVKGSVRHSYNGN